MQLTEDKIQKLHELEFEDERMKKILEAAIETWKKWDMFSVNSAKISKT